VNNYSGMAEDVIIHQLYGGQPKRFLDLGAGGGAVLSNTRYLLDQGWSGVWVDASHRSLPDLLGIQKLYKPGQVEIVHAAVDNKVGVRRIWAPSDYLITTMSKELQDRGHERTNAESFMMSTVRVADIVAALPGPYDFISIDIDGLCLDVMRDIDFKALGCTSLCIEYLPASVLGVDERPIIRKFMEETHGFRHYIETQENEIMIK
jgi:hypothetical protein